MGDGDGVLDVGGFDGSGHDQVASTAAGAAGDDWVVGERGPDALDGGGDNDTLDGKAGTTTSGAARGPTG